jgi:hypothetical protein
MWNGTWNALGAGVPSTVYSLAVDAAGDLYAGSRTSTPGALQKWDGSSWSGLGSGVDALNEKVLALAVGSLWVGGSFDEAGGKPSKNIAKWTGPMGAAPAVAANAFLEGPYAGSGAMSTALNPHLPLEQPFGGAPWFYSGDEAVDAMPANVVDWLLMELRSAPTAGSTFDRQAVLLLDDGSVVTTDAGDGSLPRFWGVPYDSTWVVLHARNHLSIMTDQKIKHSGGLWTHNFTTAMGTAFTDGGPPMKQLSDGPYGMFASDANADGDIQALDFNAYVTQTAAGASGYQSADFNLDGQVQALDFNLYLTNTLAGAGSQVP